MVLLINTAGLFLSLFALASCARLPEDASPHSSMSTAPSGTTAFTDTPTTPPDITTFAPTSTSSHSRTTRFPDHIPLIPTAPAASSVVPQVMPKMTESLRTMNKGSRQLIPEVRAKPESLGRMGAAIEGVDDGYAGTKGNGGGGGSGGGENSAQDEESDEELYDDEEEYDDDGEYDDDSEDESNHEGNKKYDNVEGDVEDKSDEVDDYNEDGDDYEEEDYDDYREFYQEGSDYDQEGKYDGYIESYWENDNKDDYNYYTDDDDDESYDEDDYDENQSEEDKKHEYLKDSDDGMVYMYLQGNDSNVIAPFYLWDHKNTQRKILVGGEGHPPPPLTLPSLGDTESDVKKDRNLNVMLYDDNREAPYPFNDGYIPKGDTVIVLSDEQFRNIDVSTDTGIDSNMEDVFTNEDEYSEINVEGTTEPSATYTFFMNNELLHQITPAVLQPNDPLTVSITSNNNKTIDNNSNNTITNKNFTHINTTKNTYSDDHYNKDDFITQEELEEILKLYKDYVLTDEGWEGDDAGEAEGLLFNGTEGEKKKPESDSSPHSPPGVELHDSETTTTEEDPATADSRLQKIKNDQDIHLRFKNTITPDFSQIYKKLTESDQLTHEEKLSLNLLERLRRTVKTLGGEDALRRNPAAHHIVKRQLRGTEACRAFSRRRRDIEAADTEEPREASNNEVVERRRRRGVSNVGRRLEQGNAGFRQLYNQYKKMCDFIAMTIFEK